MHTTAVHQHNTRTILRLAWVMLVACLLAASWPALAANGRNPSCIKAARAARAAKAAAQVAQAPMAPAKPSAHR